MIPGCSRWETKKNSVQNQFYQPSPKCSRSKFTHQTIHPPLCVNLILFAWLCQRKWEAAVCNQISQQWQGPLGKTLFLPKQITGKEKKPKLISQMIHIYTNSFAVQPNLIFTHWSSALSCYKTGVFVSVCTISLVLTRIFIHFIF